jgi:acyl transferase domain-containing protein
MDFSENPPCIVGYACRLPGGAVRPDTLFDLFNSGDWRAASTLPPRSRGFDFFESIHGVQEGSSRAAFGRGGWLGEQGLEQFDPDFFNIPASEADTLRPNIRLALELTWEALEHAGIPPSTLRGSNVSVSFGGGSEDGWDLHRVKQDEGQAFDKHWVASTDPSGISGRVSHSFDFRGTCNVVANACASGAFALRDGTPLLHCLVRGWR